MLALLLAVAPAVGAAQDTTRRAPVPGRIRGRVVTDSGGAPIAGAEVRVPAASVAVRSDSAGRYELPPMPAGPVRVFVRAVGYRDDSTDVTLRDRTVVNLELRMAFEEIAVVRRAPPPPQTPSGRCRAACRAAWNPASPSPAARQIGRAHV